MTRKGMSPKAAAAKSGVSATAGMSTATTLRSHL
jgi:hypothetical protein